MHIGYLGFVQHWYSHHNFLLPQVCTNPKSQRLFPRCQWEHVFPKCPKNPRWLLAYRFYTYLFTLFYSVSHLLLCVQIL